MISRILSGTKGGSSVMNTGLGFSRVQAIVDRIQWAGHTRAGFEIFGNPAATPAQVTPGVTTSGRKICTRGNIYMLTRGIFKHFWLI
eukprot:1191469-Prorocentrum_minimum.AAC.1